MVAWGARRQRLDNECLDEERLDENGQILPAQRLHVDAERPAGAATAEQHDEWQVGQRSFCAVSLAKLAPTSVEAFGALTPAVS